MTEVQNPSETTYHERAIPHPTNIRADEIIFLSDTELCGTLTRGLTLEVPDSILLEDGVTIKDRNVYSTERTTVECESSGLFAPKIRGHQAFGGIEHVFKTVTFGDIVPNAAVAIGSGAQIVNQGCQIATLLRSSSSPMSAISGLAKIMLPSFVSNFGFSHFKSKTTSDARTVHQSIVRARLMQFKNNKLDIQGWWEAEEMTGAISKLTLRDDLNTRKVENEFIGYSIGFNPVSVLIGTANPCVLATIAALPTVSMSCGEQSLEGSKRVSAVFNAKETKGLEVKARGKEVVHETKKFTKEQISIAVGLSQLVSAVRGLPIDQCIVPPGLSFIPQVRYETESLDEVDGEVVRHEHSVVAPGISEVISAIQQIGAMKQSLGEYEDIRVRYMTERFGDGAKIRTARSEAEEITPDVVEKVKVLRLEKHAKKARALEKIEKSLPQGAENQEVRAFLLTKYLNEHKDEIILEMERYTLREIRAEVNLCSSVKSERASEFLKNYANAELTSEELERYNEQGISEVYSATAETLNEFMIPGYSAWASGGNTTEVISSAGSDIVMTLFGGKVIKVAWQGTKALCRGAMKFGAKLNVGEILEVAANKVPYNSRAIEALLQKGGAEVTSSTLPKVRAKNVGLAGMRHPETGIVFDQRGFPIYDDIAKVEVKITGDLVNMAPDAHMRAATRQLRAEIEAGKISRELFTDVEWQQIQGGKTKIGRYTWHHHQDQGRMQLVPEKIHAKTGHVGGDDLWGIQ